jgi:hypothetical protein
MCLVLQGRQARDEGTEYPLLFGPLNFNDPFTLFLLVGATVLMIGFGIGRWVNTRLAQRTSNWLEPGLRKLGGQPVVQRVSRSAFRVIVTGARPPFATVTASVVQISREVLPTWIWERLRGDRDLLVLHVTLRTPPNIQADVVDPDNELGQRGAEQATELGWTAAGSYERFQVFAPDETDSTRLQALVALIDACPFAVRRLAVRRNAPHLLLSMALPDTRRHQSRELTQLLSKLSAKIGSR